jgi:hypothetical protein
MGFTRYWVRPRELDAKRFRAFADACQTACAELAGCLAESTFTADKVRFEGSPGCETFLIERFSTRGLFNLITEQSTMRRDGERSRGSLGVCPLLPGPPCSQHHGHRSPSAWPQ